MRNNADPLSLTDDTLPFVTDPATGLLVPATIYVGARRASGFRLPNGFFNDLVSSQSWTWGATNNLFLRLTAPNFDNYVSQNPSNVALTTYVAAHPTFVPVADNTSYYADPNKTVVDYTQRMINQTISSSDTAVFDPAVAIGKNLAAAGLNGSDWADLVMGPNTDLTIGVDGAHMIFHFVDLNTGTGKPTPVGTIEIAVQESGGANTPVTIDNALAAIRAGLRANGGAGAAGATVGVVGGVITFALADDQAHMTIQDSTVSGSGGPFFTGLGLTDGIYDPIQRPDSAWIRTGAETDVVYSPEVRTANGIVSMTEHIVRNLNTLPGDPSTGGLFTIFGQFFDHGLDFIDKGGTGRQNHHSAGARPSAVWQDGFGRPTGDDDHHFPRHAK